MGKYIFEFIMCRTNIANQRPALAKRMRVTGRIRPTKERFEVPIKFSVQKGECRAAIVIYEQTYRCSSQKVERKPNPLPHGLAVHLCPSPAWQPIYNTLGNNRTSRRNKLLVERSTSGSRSVRKIFDFVIESFCVPDCIASEEESFSLTILPLLPQL